MKKRALISVSNKKGLVSFARELLRLHYEIVSTGGTADALETEGIAVRRVAEVTDFPEILGGRVKTLHPQIFGGLLARLNEREDLADLDAQGITPISLVCVNLYPFSETVARGAVPLQEALEKIDIGGPSMIRAAAKNFTHVGVLVDPEDYSWVLEKLREQSLSLADRYRLACTAFTHTAHYDGRIAQYLTSFADVEEAGLGIHRLDFPRQFFLHLTKSQDLRYGENPHQKASYYLESEQVKPPWVQHQGKDLSFNNILDATAALQLVTEFRQPGCVIVKHTNPCGAACDEKEVRRAYEDALACDPVSAFGGIVAMNRPLTAELAHLLVQHFFEVILAPEIAPEALTLLKVKKNLRLLAWQGQDSAVKGFDLKCVWPGFLVQGMDGGREDLISRHGFDSVEVVTKRQPTAEEWVSLSFAWKVARFVKSNAIVLATGQKTVGIGAGQMSRVDASQLATGKAKERAKGAVLASDAFFPFRDGVDACAQAGVRALVQPGGSVRDREVIEAANEHDLAMVFTGRRHFRH